VAGVLGCALTGLLISPISWDHHWVWIVPIAVAFVVCALRAASAASRWGAAAAAAGLVAVFGAWPGSLWHLPANTGGFFEGIIWIPPVTNPELYFQLGDRPGYAEYHWHGLQLVTGNAYVLAGIALFALLVVLAVRAARATRPEHASAQPSRLTPAAAPPTSG
jgi:alpha-1,2-mannosyltransferase